MCGIAGVFNYRSGEPADGTLLRAMTRSLAHRGPDDEGFRLDGAVGLGMRRLSIIDLEGGAQPLSGESGTTWVVCNGEIYNFRQLRRLLERSGHQFRTRSDTEVIVHAYEQWDFDALARLNGMFGLALWDGANRRLILARDPFGVKPLYYYDDGRRLLFGSEIRAILRDPGVERRVDLEALDEYLTLDFVPAPKTAFAGIQKLLPGHALVTTSAGVQVRRFYEVLPQPVGSRAETDLVEQLRVELTRAVERQMVADVPVGALLSGGIDSTMVATLMARSSGAPIKTLRRMLVDHRSGRQDNSRVLFNLLTFELWHERFISGPAGSDAGHGVDRLAVAEAVS
jgi:asparagine synthase (glutamine-hydrolysing)